MDREETKNIIRVITDCYANFKPQNLSELITTWAMILSEYDYKEIQAALVAYTRSDTSGFAPTPGQLIDWSLKLRHDKSAEMSALEAWSLVYKAIGNSGYNSEEEFEKLPDPVKRAVGNPANLKEWALMDIETVQSVEQSHFIRAYNTELQRMREDLKLPEGMRRPPLEMKPVKRIEDKTEPPIQFTGKSPQDLIAQVIARMEAG